MSTITTEFKAHVADIVQDVVNEMKNATPEQIYYLQTVMNTRLDWLKSVNTWYPIDTAPMDGTIIIGKWEDDPDPRPQEVKFDDSFGGWAVLQDETWNRCTPPTHWQPIN